MGVAVLVVPKEGAAGLAERKAARGMQVVPKAAVLVVLTEMPAAALRGRGRLEFACRY